MQLLLHFVWFFSFLNFFEWNQILQVSAYFLGCSCHSWPTLSLNWSGKIVPISSFLQLLDRTEWILSMNLFLSSRRRKGFARKATTIYLVHVNFVLSDRTGFPCIKFHSSDWGLGVVCQLLCQDLRLSFKLFNSINTSLDLSWVGLGENYLLRDELDLYYISPFIGSSY